MSRIQVAFEKVVLVKEKAGRYELPRETKSPEEAYNKNKIVAAHEVSRGTLNTSMVHPREVFKPAVLHNAAAIICFHNHPSGDPEPSREDIEITERLKNAGEILGIPVYDHIIVGDDRCVSLKERGVM